MQTPKGGNELEISYETARTDFGIEVLSELNQLPRKSPGPVKPKIRLNTVLAGVVGLFLTVFLAFFIEYISKYKRREAD